jgi:hypothetical protein
LFWAKRSFCGCKSLESVIFESGSRLERIEGLAFAESGLLSIVIPSSIVAMGDGSFYGCKSLKSVSFESGTRLELIDESAFLGTLLFSVVSPQGVAFVDEWEEVNEDDDVNEEEEWAEVNEEQETEEDEWEEDWQ